MKQATSRAIVLRRIDFQEADRIITFLTSNHGKITCIAKGVRKPGSKLAGGIELLSINDISFVFSRSDLGTLTSSRMQKHYLNILSDIDRTTLAFEILKYIDKYTQDSFGDEYFEITKKSLEGLNNMNLSVETVGSWFYVNLLKISGHDVNLGRSADGQQLNLGSKFYFDLEAMAFRPGAAGIYESNDIKLLRLMQKHDVDYLSKVVQANLSSSKIIDLLVNIVKSVL